MVVDASDMLAICFGEPERAAVLDILTATDQPVMAPVNAWEVLARAQSAPRARPERARSLMRAQRLRRCLR
jgi:uncharacterized protein with PIN domain